MEKSEVPAEKPPLIERIVASDKTAEIMAGQAMVILEDSRRMISQPHKPLFESGQISINPPETTIGGWAFHHIGDVEEVAYLFSATRLALVGVNEALKRVTKKEIPDEACFWASMITSVAIPSMVELNMMPLFKANMNTADPADLFGVGIGALVIIATHYGSKNREAIKNFTSSVTSKITEKARSIKEKINPKAGYVDSSQLAKR